MSGLAGAENWRSWEGAGRHLGSASTHGPLCRRSHLPYGPGRRQRAAATLRRLMTRGRDVHCTAGAEWRADRARFPAIRNPFAACRALKASFDPRWSAQSTGRGMHRELSVQLFCRQQFSFFRRDDAQRQARGMTIERWSEKQRVRAPEEGRLQSCSRQVDALAPAQLLRMPRRLASSRTAPSRPASQLSPRFTISSGDV